MKKKNDFPMDDTVNAACNRAEAILDLYKKAGCAENWQERLLGAIADLAILSHCEAAVAHAEARAEAGPGDHCGSSGYDARHACEEAGERAVELMDQERLRAGGGLYDEVLP